MASSSVSKEKKKAPVSKEKKPQASAEDSSAFGPIAERFRRAGDLDRAVSLCREGLQKFPDRISARVTLGWALLELGKYDEAQAELEQVLRQRPDNLAAIRALAELHDRAEQTLNLPMDGPGQWPPSPDAVDEVGSMVAGSFLKLNDADGLDGSANGAGAPVYETSQPAVVPPAELGLAMWSALPATEPEPEPVQEFPGRTLFVGNDGKPIATVAVEPEEQPAWAARNEEEQPAMAARAEEEVSAPAASSVSDADLAALLAEADSLDALADVAPQPAVAFQAMAEAADAAAATDVEPALVLDDAESSPDLEELTWGVPAQVAPKAEPEIHAAVEMPFEAEPAFQLESLSIGAVEAMPLEAELAVEPASYAVDPDLQPILRFDLEPVAERVAEPVAEAIAQPEAAFVPEPFVAAVATQEVVESAVIAHTQARIAAVVSMASMARATETAAAPGRSQLQALEHFLSCVHARRQRVLTESVA